MANTETTLMAKARFLLQPYRSETLRIPLLRKHSGRTSIDMDTIEYATFRYDTVKLENGFNVDISFGRTCM